MASGQQARTTRIVLTSVLRSDAMLKYIAVLESTAMPAVAFTDAHLKPSTRMTPTQCNMAGSAAEKANWTICTAAGAGTRCTQSLFVTSSRAHDTR